MKSPLTALVYLLFGFVMFFALWSYLFLKKNNKNFGWNILTVFSFFASNFCGFAVISPLGKYISDALTLIPLISFFIGFALVMIYAKRRYRISVFKSWVTYVCLVIVTLDILFIAYIFVLLPQALSMIGPLYH